MRLIVAAAILFMATSTQAATRLVVTNPSGGVTSVRYGTRAQCERARAAIAADGRRQIERMRRAATAANMNLVVPPQTTSAICIPG